MDLDLTWMTIVIADAEAGQMCDCNLWTSGTDAGVGEPLASVVPAYKRDAPEKIKTLEHRIPKSSLHCISAPRFWDTSEDLQVLLILACRKPC